MNSWSYLMRWQIPQHPLVLYHHPTSLFVFHLFPILLYMHLRCKVTELSPTLIDKNISFHLAYTRTKRVIWVLTLMTMTTYILFKVDFICHANTHELYPRVTDRSEWIYSLMMCPQLIRECKISPAGSSMLPTQSRRLLGKKSAL